MSGNKMVKYKVINSSRTATFIIKGYGNLGPGCEIIVDERPEGGKNLEVIPIDEPSKIIDSNLLNYDELEKVNGIGPISAKKILMICKNKDDIPKKLNELYFRLHDNVVRTLLKYYKINIKEGE